MKVKNSENNWMRNKKFFYVTSFFLIGYSLMGFSQDFSEFTLKGKVSSTDGDVSAIHVLNLTAGKAAITDADGFFSITARLFDTIVFSSIQYQTKQLLVTKDISESTTLFVPLEEAVNELDEVIVMPYNLTGQLARDMNKMQVGAVLTASTLGLPNANVQLMPYFQRKLYSAQNGGTIIKVLNVITGETKRLKEQAASQWKYLRTEEIRRFYHDTLFIQKLKIPKEKIDDFMRFCEIDAGFASTRTSDKLRLWEIMMAKSIIYRKNNELEETSEKM